MHFVHNPQGIAGTFACHRLFSQKFASNFVQFSLFILHNMVSLVCAHRNPLSLPPRRAARAGWRAFPPLRRRLWGNSSYFFRSAPRRGAFRPPLPCGGRAPFLRFLRIRAPREKTRILNKNAAGFLWNFFSPRSSAVRGGLTALRRQCYIERTHCGAPRAAAQTHSNGGAPCTQKSLPLPSPSSIGTENRITKRTKL